MSASSRSATMNSQVGGKRTSVVYGAPTESRLETKRNLAPDQEPGITSLLSINQSINQSYSLFQTQQVNRSIKNIQETR